MSFAHSSNDKENDALNKYLFENNNSEDEDCNIDELFLKTEKGCDLEI